MSIKSYRDTGAAGALLDEYEKAVRELQAVVRNLSQSELIAVVDQETKDPDCQSIQGILMHVVSSGHNYVVIIRKSLGEDLPYFAKAKLPNINAYCSALDELMAYNVQLFEDYPGLKLEELETEKKILVQWGQHYDPEQLLEHAIVHILRHRRQIERFRLRLRA